MAFVGLNFIHSIINFQTNNAFILKNIEFRSLRTFIFSPAIPYFSSSLNFKPRNCKQRGKL